jgi:hypothetical protein
MSAAMKRSTFTGFILSLVVCIVPPGANAKSDDFKSVVKVIEQFYGVKHQQIPFPARAGMKTARTMARIAGGNKWRIAEAGSVKVAFFEDQDFTTSKNEGDLRRSLNNMLSTTWSPLIQVIAPRDHNQSYIFLRNAGDKFNVLVVQIETREAWVVQVDVSPSTLAALLQTPDEMGKVISDDAMRNDDQE